MWKLQFLSDSSKNNTQTSDVSGTYTFFCTVSLKGICTAKYGSNQDGQILFQAMKQFKLSLEKYYFLLNRGVEEMNKIKFSLSSTPQGNGMGKEHQIILYHKCWSERLSNVKVKVQGPEDQVQGLLHVQSDCCTGSLGMYKQTAEGAREFG